MRLRRLNFEKYGHFDGVALDLPTAARLHVVLGANEAGKTTALAAIGDLLFGFGARSDFGFRHGQPNLRIGAELEGADGAGLAVVRRKGRGQTLAREDGTPVAEAALAALLGGIGRPAFETMFGLDGERLRRGGEDLLGGRGSLGVTLFQAAAGVSGVAKLAGELEAEARRHYDARRAGERTFYVAADAYEAARKRLRELEVRHDDWQAARNAVMAAEAALTADLARHGTVERERRGLERLVRIAPMLRAVAENESVLAELGDAPALPADARREWEEAVRQRQVAGPELADAQAKLVRIAEEMQRLAPPGTLAPVRDAIEALYKRSNIVEQALHDATRLHDEAAAEARGIEAALAGLGLDLTPDAALARLPPAVARNAVQRLVQTYGAVRLRLSDGLAVRDATARACTAAEEALASLPAAEDLAALRAVVERLRRAGDLEAPVAAAARAAEAAAGRAAAERASLPLWSGEASALAALTLPDEATVRRHQKRLDAAAAALAKRRDAAAERAERSHQAEQRSADLAAASDLATADTVAALRRRRDAWWEHLRQAHLLPGLAAPEALADAYAGMVAAADREADRRLAAGERAAALDQARQDAADRAQELALSEQAAHGAADDLAAAEAGWRAEWAAAGIVPLPPAEMERWLARRTRVLERHDEALAAAEATALARDRATAARAELASLLPCAPGDTVGVLLTRAETAIAAGDDARRALKDATSELARARRDGAEAADRLAAAERAAAEWQARWVPALAAAGLAPGIAPDDAPDVLAGWEAIDRHGATWVALRARIAEIERDEAGFRADAARWMAVVAPDLAEADPFAATPELHARLGRELADADLRRGLGREEAEARKAERRHQDALQAAGRTLDRLRQGAAVADEDALEPAIARAESRADLRARIEDARNRAAALAEGEPLAALTRQAIAADLDAVRTRIDALDIEAADIMGRREALGAARRDAESRLASLETGLGAAAAAQQRHDAAAAMAASVRSYARLHVAARLLRHGIDRFRQRQQGPLLERGGAHFAALTAGRYDRLLVGFERDEPELQVGRPDGTELGVGALSEGTRDQLYLALRIAAIETYAAGAEPLPLIGDDLLVHFDDTRAAAALRLLAGLGERMQTILFTHHRHLAELARAEIAGDRLAIHVLPGP